MRRGRFAEVIEYLAQQNSSVMATRGGAAWIETKRDKLVVRFKEENGKLPARDDLGQLWRFPYFLDSLRSTGTVVCCWLLRHGYATPSNVFQILKELRQADVARASWPAPENETQRAFVLASANRPKVKQPKKPLDLAPFDAMSTTFVSASDPVGALCVSIDDCLDRIACRLRLHRPVQTPG